MKKSLILVAGILSLATVAIAAIKSAEAMPVSVSMMPTLSAPPSWTLLDMAEHAITIPEGATLQDYENSGRNLAFGTNDPTSIVPGDPQGNINITVMGISLPTGEKKVVVSLQDETPDMVEARLYVNDLLKKTATRENGGIVDSAGQAFATMTTYINLNTVGRIATKWTDSAGYERYYDLHNF